MDDLTVRPASRDDDHALRDLDAAAWGPGSGFPSVGHRTRFFGPDADPGRTLVAQRRDTVVGYVSVARPTPLPENAHVQSVVGLAVLPAERRRGVATLLLQAVLDRARQEGARKVSLRVLASNTAARRLYERLGFEVEGVLGEEFLVDGRLVDDVLMARRLR